MPATPFSSSDDITFSTARRGYDKEEVQSFVDQVKDTITSQLTQQKAKQTLKDLHGAAKIDVVDPEIKKSMQNAAVRGEAPPENEPEPTGDVEDNH